MPLRTSVLPAAVACTLLAAGPALANPEYPVIPGMGAPLAESPRGLSRAQVEARQQQLALAEARAQASARLHAQAYWQAQAEAGAYARMRHASALYNSPSAQGNGSLGAAPRSVPITQPIVDPRAQAQAARPGPQPQMAALTPAVDPLSQRVDPKFQRAVVPYAGPHAPGTIIVDTPSRYLYLVQPGKTAIRYGIGVGRPGFEWAGVKHVSRKAEWPDWTPPPEMLKRRPDLPKFMKGGIDNPLGARALYLGSSLYRIHGTNEPWTIGQNVSSGCIRMMNDDVVDLYQRVRVGTRVIVI